MSAERRLKELAVALPAPPEPFGIYAEAVKTGNLLFLTGMLPTEGRSAKIVGRVGAELNVEAGRKAAYLGAQRPGCCSTAFGIARQSDPDCPAGRVGGNFGRCSRSAESGRRRVRVDRKRLRERQEPEPPGIWRCKSSARHSRGAGTHFRGGGVTKKEETWQLREPQSRR